MPHELRAGPCIEVWADPTRVDATYSAQRRFSAARDAWLTEHGLNRWEDRDRVPDALRMDRSPWSFDYLARTNAARLADKLARHGLPHDWMPAPMEPTEPRRTPPARTQRPR